MSNAIASTILGQLGGNRFRAMTGAKEFVSTERGLRFKLPRGFAKNSINFVHIQLTEADLYDVGFYSEARGGLSLVERAAHEGVYADALRQLFTAETGLETSL